MYRLPRGADTPSDDDVENEGLASDGEPTEGREVFLVRVIREAVSYERNSIA